ncbi:MAG: esterase family protein [Planctomycetes bacterium]|nr:esterase family protein [Planctomycetota bacterium]
MNQLLRELAEQGRNEGAIDAFLEKHELPFVDGSKVTFVFHGFVDEVYLQHWIFGLPSSQQFERMPGTNLFHLTIDIPARSRVEYKLEIRKNGQRRLIADPHNPHFARDPYGANSVVQGAGYEFPDWALEDSEARRGETQDHKIESRVFGGARDLRVYLPARYRPTRRYPLLVMHDGQDYERFASLVTILDNLTHRLEIPQMVVVMTQSPNRLHEYADDPRHADFIADEVVSWADERFSLVDSPSARGLGGASFGAVASLSTALRKPGVFENLFLQSGSFAFTDIGDHDRGPLFDPVVQFVNRYRDAPTRPAQRIFVSCGTYESLIYYNRSMVPILRDTGAELRYVEARDGHNWENWRDRMREGLSWLFPGPLWLVYE